MLLFSFHASLFLSAISASRDSALLPLDLIANVCAAVQLAITQLICRRVQRAIELTTVHSNLLSSGSLPSPTKLVSFSHLFPFEFRRDVINFLLSVDFI